MRRSVTSGISGLLLCILSAPSIARPDEAPAAEPATLHRAARRGLEIVQRAARNYPDHRSCFSCHHQTLPVLAMVTGRDHGLRVDEDLIREQAAFTHASFQSRAGRMKRGTGVGGASMTVGYGLWTLAIAARQPDDTSHAMVTFLLKTQEKDGHWKRSSNRPPLEESNVTCTVLAVHYMGRFAADDQRQAVEKATARAKAWLLEVSPVSQEDRNSLLGGLSLLRAGPAAIDAARRGILDARRPDGGWAQLPGMESDAYATGQTLFTLRRTGLSPDDPLYRRALKFLLDTQCDDGSWRVETRSRPVQIFFDGGGPHGKHQFISVPATAWATTALALALPRPEVRRF